MARRPLPEMIQLTARVPRGEAGFWQIMLQLDKEHRFFTVAEVEGESNVKAGAVAQYLRKLVKGGFAKHVADRVARVRPAKVYCLIKRPAEAPRLRADGSELGRTDRECMWTAMRAMARGFSAREIAFAAQTTRRPIKVASADSYIRLLAAAGYVVAFGTFWRLKPSMNTGPLAPAVLRIQAVFDRNLGKVMGESSEAKELAA